MGTDTQTGRQRGVGVSGNSAKTVCQKETTHDNFRRNSAVGEHSGNDNRQGDNRGHCTSLPRLRTASGRNCYSTTLRRTDLHTTNRFAFFCVIRQCSLPFSFPLCAIHRKIFLFRFCPFFSRQPNQAPARFAAFSFPTLHSIQLGELKVIAFFGAKLPPPKRILL